MVIAVLVIFHIDLETYNQGGNLISIFLGPSTVVLAVPLYKQLDLLKKNLLPIIAGILAGSLTAIVSVCLFAKWFGLNKELGLSLVPKSITTPIGIELTKQLGGIPSVTVAAIIITGIIGAMLAPGLLKLLRITDKVAVGLAIGTSAHAVGTSKAIELGETEGAMSALAIGVAGLMTVFLAPVLVKLLG